MKLFQKSLEFAQVVTRGGDQGQSSLFTGERRYKDDDYFEALGGVDELSSWLGVVKHHEVVERVLPNACQQLERLQGELLAVGAKIASPDGSNAKDLTPAVEHLELLLAKLMETTPIEPQFVLPGATPSAAWTDVARTVCRRVERRLVALIRHSGRTDLADAQKLLNRLSDFLFVLARAVC